MTALQISAGVFDVSNNPAIYTDPEEKANYINGLLDENVHTYQNIVDDLPLGIFNYKAALQEWNVSYIACRETDVLPKFMLDPAFSTVFINNEVAVFKVKSNSFS